MSTAVSSHVPYPDLFHNFSILCQTGERESFVEKDVCKSRLLSALYCYPVRLKWFYNSVFCCYPKESIPALIHKSIQVIRPVYLKYYLNYLLYLFPPQIFQILNLLRGSAIPIGVDWLLDKEKIVERQLTLTHEAYHHRLNRILKVYLPIFEDYLVKVCNGMSVHDRSVRQTVIEIQQFHEYTHLFFKKVVHGNSKWLKEIFNHYFCKDCFEGFHEIKGYYSLANLQSVMGKRLPFPLILHLVWGKAVDEELLASFIEDLHAAQPDPQTLLQAFERIYKHVEKHHRISAVKVEGQMPSFGHFLMTLRNQCLALAKIKNVAFERLNIFEQNHIEHLAWRDSLKVGNSVTLRHFEKEGDKTFFCMGEYVIGKPLSIKPLGMFDKLIYFEISRASQSRFEWHGEELNGDLCPQVSKKEMTPLKNLSEFVLCIANNEAALSILQETIFSLQKGIASPYGHPGMGLLPFDFIDLEGRAAIGQKLQTIFDETNGSQRKKDIAFQKRISNLLGNLVKMDYTPVPLDVKYLMQGKSKSTASEGRLLAYYGKLTLKGEKDFFALEKFAHDLAKGDPSFLKCLLENSGIRETPVHNFYRQAALNAFTPERFQPKKELTRQSFRGRLIEGERAEKLQENLRTVAQMAALDISHLEPTRSLSQDDLKKINQIILDIYLHSGWTFQLPPLIQRNTVDRFLMKV